MPPTSLASPKGNAGGAGGRRDVENEGDGNEDTGGDRQIKRFQRMFGGFIHAGIFSDFRRCRR